MTNQYYTSATDAVPGTTVRSAQFNDNNDSVEQGFDLLPDPQTLFSSSQNFTDATTDPLNENIYLATVAAQRITSLTDGAAVTIRAPSANTGPSQFNLNALGLKQIRTPFNQPLVSGDIPSGAVLELRYNLVGDYWQLESALTAVVRAEEAARTAQEAADQIAALEPQIVQNTAEIESLNARVGQTSIRVAMLNAPMVKILVPNGVVCDLGGLLSFSRVSSATYKSLKNQNVTANNDELRQERDGWLFEGAAQNLLTNPTSPATQTVTIPAGTFTLSVDGTGEARTTYGDSSESSPVTFTSSGEDLLITIIGTVDRFQLEAGQGKTSFVDGSRSADSLTLDVATDIPDISNPFTIAGTFDNNQNLFCLLDLTNLRIETDANGVVQVNGTNASVAESWTDKTNFALVYDGTSITIYIDGSANTAVAIPLTNQLTGSARIGARLDGSNPISGHVEILTVYDFALTSEEVGYLYIQRA